MFEHRGNYALPPSPAHNEWGLRMLWSSRNRPSIAPNWRLCHWFSQSLRKTRRRLKSPTAHRCLRRRTRVLRHWGGGLHRTRTALARHWGGAAMWTWVSRCPPTLPARPATLWISDMADCTGRLFAVPYVCIYTQTISRWIINLWIVESRCQ
jgi:hypothetical protein